LDFAEHLQLAEEQIVLVAEVQIERGAADKGAVEHILHGYVFDRLLVDQLNERHAEPCTGPGGARIGVAPLLQSRLCGTVVLRRVCVLGHRRPRCSSIRSWRSTRMRIAATLQISMTNPVRT
jgi:hypothetical protein